MQLPFHLPMTKAIYADPTNYGIIKSRTHKWDYNDYRHYLVSIFFYKDITNVLSHGDSLPKWDDADSQHLVVLSTIADLVSTIILKATGILQTNLSFERCHYSTRLCPALYYTYYYSHYNLSKSLS